MRLYRCEGPRISAASIRLCRVAIFAASTEGMFFIQALASRCTEAVKMAALHFGQP